MPGTSPHTRSVEQQVLRPPGRPSALKHNKGVALVLSGLLGLLSAGLLVLFVVNLLSATGGKGLGRNDFSAGRASFLAEEYANRGPILFQALQGDKDVYLLHQGDDAAAGWWAVQAAPPGRPRRCGVRYDAAGLRFVDGCDPSALYPLSGTGLTAFPVEVHKGPEVVIDLHAPYSGPAVPSPPTTTSTTSSPGG